MSVTTSFRYLRPLPFCQSEFTSSTGSYVLLNEVGGDKGLSEAMRLFWNLEIYGIDEVFWNIAIDDVEFSSAVRFEVEQWEFADNYSLSGAVVAGYIRSSPPLQYEPRERVRMECASGVQRNQVFAQTVAFEFVSEYISSFSLQTQLRFVSDRWRLYYTIGGGLINRPPGDPDETIMFIRDPYTASLLPWAVDYSGTLDFCGYDLDWEAGVNTDLSPAPIWGDPPQFFDPYSVFWTYPPP